MAYSFNIRAANKAAAKAAVDEKLSDAVSHHNCSEANKVKTQVNADAAIDNLEDGKEIAVDVSGTLDNSNVSAHLA